MSLEKIKASMGPTGFPCVSAASTAGMAGVTGGMNAQCPLYSAPSAIHCRSVATCFSVRGGFVLVFGGMWSSSSVVRMRLRSGLSSGLPGTMAGPSDFPPLSAAALLSRRSSLLIFAVSGPWQVKQLSERIGRTSRLKSILASAWRVPPALNARQRAASRREEKEVMIRRAGVGRFSRGCR